MPFMLCYVKVTDIMLSCLHYGLLFLGKLWYRRKEKSTEPQPKKTKKEKKAKDPSKPKRPPTAFFLFM